MSFFDTIKQGLQNHFGKRKEDQEMMDRLRQEATMQQQVAFEQQFKEDARIVAIAKAKQDAARLSGRQAMVAHNRAIRLQEKGVSSGTFFDKMRDYTQKNIAKREENLKRTAEMKEKAQQLQAQRQQERTQGRTEILPNRNSSIGGSTWKM